MQVAAPQMVRFNCQYIFVRCSGIHDFLKDILPRRDISPAGYSLLVYLVSEGEGSANQVRVKKKMPTRVTNDLDSSTFLDMHNQVGVAKGLYSSRIEFTFVDTH